MSVNNFLDKYKIKDKTTSFNLLSVNKKSKYFLEDDSFEILHNAIISDTLSNRLDNYLIEVKTTVFNFFLDIDFKDIDEFDVDPPFIVMMVSLLEKVLVEFFGDTSPKIVVSKKRNNCNLHFNCPDIHVTIKTSLSIRDRYIEYLTYRYDWDWNTIVDRQIIINKNNGLRMLGMPKMDNSGNRIDEGYLVIDIDLSLIDYNYNTSSEESYDKTDEPPHKKSKSLVTEDNRIVYHPITVNHLQHTSLRYSGKVTPIVIDMDDVIRVDVPIKSIPAEINKIIKHITHTCHFSKQLNSHTYIFLNDGERDCMVQPGVIHYNNNFYVSKNLSNQYYYNCHWDECKAIGPKYLFTQQFESKNFEKNDLKKIASSKSMDSGLIIRDIIANLNQSFAYICHKDLYMEVRNDELVYYKSLSNRLKYQVSFKSESLDKKEELKEDVKTIMVSETWTHSLDRREYDRVIFEPYLIPPAEPDNINYNIFTGFQHDYQNDFLVNNDIIKPILDHIMKVWCTNNHQIFLYIIGWFADIIKHPNKLSGIAVIIQGQQGTGKSSVANFIGNDVIGSKYYISTNNFDHVTGRFNGIIEGKLLILNDETSNFGGAIASNAKFKGVVTEEWQSIERKFHEIEKVRNCARQMITTNNKRCIKVEAPDRRMACFTANSIYKGNRPYFDKLHKSFNPLVANHFFHFLANWSEPWDKSDIPMTNFRRELMTYELPTTLSFLLNEINLGINEDGNQKILYYQNSNAIIEIYSNYELWYSQFSKTEYKKSTIKDFLESLNDDFNVSFETIENDNYTILNCSGKTGNFITIHNIDNIDKILKERYGFFDSIGV
ncbi:MAG: DUF5906 domain-containing protein [Clostridium sp.]